MFLISAKSRTVRKLASIIDKIKEIFTFTRECLFSKSYKIHDLESVAILKNVIIRKTAK